MLMIDVYGNGAPADAEHFDTFWKQFLKVKDGRLMVNERGRWSVSQHRDGVEMLNNGECVPVNQKG